MAAPAHRANAGGLGALAAALAAAALVQWTALRAPFFADDWLFLDQVRARTLLAALRSADPIGNFFRPLGRAAWFWLLARAGGETPGVFHVANLALWLVCVALLWGIARTLAGPRAAALAAAIYAVTPAADVPVMWACGAQDLLAAALGLGAIALFLRGRAWGAAALLALAALAKETAVVALVPMLALAWARGEPWRALSRRAWPAAAALAAWGALALAHAPAQPGGGVVAPALAGPPAALAGLVRSALSLEWRTNGVPFAPFVPPGRLEALAILAVAAAAGRAGAPRPRETPAGPPALRSPRGTMLAASAWALAAAAPVALVAPTWSAYYFLFALGGVALALALALERAPRAGAFAVVAALALAGSQARAVEEFATAPSPWSAQSHVNRFYLRRGMAVMSRTLAQLRRLHPALPHGSTLFFNGLPAFSAFQTGDGPLVRGAYRDGSLRSFYVSGLAAARASAGPVFLVLLDTRTGELADCTQRPGIWTDVAIGNLLGGHADGAREAFRIAAARDTSALLRYGIALTTAAEGDTSAARAMLAALGFGTARRSDAALDAIRQRLAAGDYATAARLASAARARAVYDPEPHEMLATALLVQSAMSPEGYLEAFAPVALDPGNAAAWRAWSAAQRILPGHDEGALASLDRYFALDPAARAGDTEARAWADSLRERLGGGRIAQLEMKRFVQAR